MKHILLLVSIALPLICGANTAMAFAGLGNIHHLFSQEATPQQPSQPKQKPSKKAPRAAPKQSQ